MSDFDEEDAKALGHFDPAAPAGERSGLLKVKVTTEGPDRAPGPGYHQITCMGCGKTGWVPFKPAQSDEETAVLTACSRECAAKVYAAANEYGRGGAN